PTSEQPAPAAPKATAPAPSRLARSRLRRDKAAGSCGEGLGGPFIVSTFLRGTNGSAARGRAGRLAHYQLHRQQVPRGNRLAAEAIQEQRCRPLAGLLERNAYGGQRRHQIPGEGQVVATDQ